MFRNMIWLFATIAFAGTAAAQDTAEPPPPVEILVLGSYHFANPGRDVVNMQVADVLTPERQREIILLARTLAQWKPTKVVVEAEADAPGFELQDYADVEQLLATRRNESIQIGYRIADMLGHEAVYGFDEQPSEGEPNYFPMGKVQEFAAGNGQMPLIEGLIGEVRRRVAEEEAKQGDQSIAESLLVHNDSATVDREHFRLYYSLIAIGDGNAQPGAELNAYWYMRNAKMFGKIDMIAEPGDRVLLIVGSGHATWLRHFAAHMPGYRVVDAMPYLLGAAAASEALQADAEQ